MQKSNRFAILLSATAFLTTVSPQIASSQEVIRVQNGAILSLQPGATMTLTGGITLDNGSGLVHAGTITLKQNGADGPANWIDNTTTPYSYGTGNAVLNSSTIQTIRTPNTFGQLTINTAGIDLAANTTANTWLLINGIVNTNTYAAITAATGPEALPVNVANPGYAKSWINGTIRRYITPATVDSYDFPIGNDGQSNLVTLANLKASPLTGTTYLDASFSTKPGNDAGLFLTEDRASYISINNAGVWHLTPNTEPTGGKFDLLLYLGGFSTLADNSFAPLERPDASTNAADWSVPPGSFLPNENTPGRTVVDGYARRNSISSFSQWGIGTTSTPLPVTLLSFDASRLSKQFVDLHWQTATEQNNKGFGIERRLDDQTIFSDIAFVPTKAPGGNSTGTLSYSFTDTNSYAGISYYRLKQQDLDDRFAYTIIKAVSGSANGLVVSLYPNPGHGQFTLRVDGTYQKYTALITDLLGHTLRQIEAVGNTNVSVIGLSAGFYLVHIPDIFGQNHSFTQKLLIVP